MRIIGIDCATDPAKTGLALGFLSDAGLEIQEAAICTRERRPVETIERWLGISPSGGLIAIDAPLGWPEPLGGALAQHMAGAAFTASADKMFRRATDRSIKQRLGKTPLDVGADRIARTAHTALHLLEELREKTGRRIPLAWEVTDAAEQLCAIEVYPAATLIAIGAPSTGYKKAGQDHVRRDIEQALQAQMRIRESVPDLTENAHVLDAAICVLAGADFLLGRAMPPRDLPLAALARREGWIWAADGDSSPTLT